MVIRKVNRNTFDVFMSEQYFGDWTRISRRPDGTVYGVQGRRLNAAALQAVSEAIKDH